MTLLGSTENAQQTAEMHGVDSCSGEGVHVVYARRKKLVDYLEETVDGGSRCNHWESTWSSAG